MTMTKSERTLDYVEITGAGVDALDRRKEHNDNEQVTAPKLQQSIEKVKTSIFGGFKALSAGARKRIVK